MLAEEARGRRDSKLKRGTLRPVRANLPEREHTPRPRDLPTADRPAEGGTIERCGLPTPCRERPYDATAWGLADGSERAGP